MASAGDDVVWRYARENALTIVSKDSDFHQRSFTEGHPPKVIWIRLGNCATGDIAVLLHEHAPAILKFVADTDASFLALG